MSDVIKISKVLAINSFDLSPGFYLGSHTHTDWEFIYADTGTLDYVKGDKRMTLSKGEIMFHSPDTPHSTVCDGVHSASFFNMIIRTGSRGMRCFENRAFKVPKELLPILRALIKEAERTYVLSVQPLSKRPDAPEDGEQMVRNLCEVFLLSLRRHLMKTEKAPDGAVVGAEGGAFVEEVTAYLTKNLSRPVTLDEISEQLHFGKTYLCVQFRKNTGRTILDHFLDMKITAAKKLLRESDDSIREISEGMGFVTPEYFSRVFKKRVGYTPSEYRRILITDKKIRK